MSATPARLLHHLRRLAGGGSAGSADAELLAHFVAARDGEAFAALVGRHGPLVWGVCRRLLADPRDAEDAFQAAFLVLARRAAAVRPREALAAWLHGVARRVALKARAAAARRRSRQPEGLAGDPPGRRPDPLDQLTAGELLAVIDEEVRRLPAAYRLPVVLCYLEGRTQEEAARLLGWPPGALRGRLDRGRARLQARLTRRGLAPPAALLAASFGAGESPASLVTATVRAALGGVAAPRAAALAGAAPRGRALAALLLAVGVAAGAVVLARPAPPEPETAPAELPAPQAAAEGPRTDLYGDPLPPGAMARMGTVRFRHGSWISAAAFGPDGKTVATAGEDKLIRFWDTATGKGIRRLNTGPAGVVGLSTGPRGKLVALLCSDESSRLWDVNAGRPAGEPFRHGGRVNTAALSADGMVCLTGGEDGVVVVWDPAAGKELRRLPRHDGAVEFLAVSADGRLAASGTGRGTTVRLWDVGGGKLLHELTGNPGSNCPAAFSPDGKLFASLFEARGVALWDVATGKELRRLGPRPGYGVSSLLFADDGKTLVSCADVTRFWDVGTGREVRQLALPPRSAKHALFSPDGKTLATWGDNKLHLVDPATRRERAGPAGHPTTVNSASLSADGRRLVTTCFGDAARVWDVTTGRQVLELPPRSEDCYAAAALSPDGRLVATADPKGSVVLARADTGEEVRRLAVPKTMSVAFSPDGRRLVTGGSDRVARLWDTATGRELRTVRVAAKDPMGGLNFPVAFAVDGTRLVTADPVTLWDAATGEKLREFPMPQFGGGRAAAVSPDGRLVAAGWDEADGRGASVRLYEADGGKVVATLRGLPDGSASALAFSPDGKTLAAGGMGARVVLWEVASGAEVVAPAGHSGWGVLRVCFTPDGRRLITAGSDTTALVWDLPTLALGARPAPADPERLWADLSEADAARAWRATWRLAAAPREAVALLRRRLRPAEPPDAARLSRLVAALDAERFAERERAARELEAAGEVAAPALRKALGAGPAPEARRRIEGLLENCTGPTPARLLALRATAVLEHAGTPEARALLEALARGAPGAMLTREAKASLDRLARRPGPAAP
jgi:RNA polymerase sigma factor (sigma-70 family)